jgi:hypothetical protein
LPSFIESAGKGLFALARFQRDDFITNYGGILQTTDKLVSKAYALSAGKGLVFDASSSFRTVGQRGLGRFANHQPQRSANARFVVAGTQSARLCATKRIEVGDEIYVNYGPSYWSEEHDAASGKIHPVVNAVAARDAAVVVGKNQPSVQANLARQPKRRRTNK